MNEEEQPLRVGIVDFLNSRPLAWGFLRGSFEGHLVPSYHPPSRVADLLASGEIDVGLIPSIEVLRIEGAGIVPGTCVAATREVRSVLLLLRRPIGEVRRIALDVSSRTSVALLQILLAEAWHTEAELEVRAPSEDGVEQGFDAALLIGDPALRVDRSSFDVVDLAAAWRRLTGLPFVFAVWATRSGLEPSSLSVHFDRSLAEGRRGLEQMIEEASAELGLPPAEIRFYLTENLRFTLGAEEIAGLREFYAKAYQHGLVDRLEPLEGSSLASLEVTS